MRMHTFYILNQLPVYPARAFVWPCFSSCFFFVPLFQVPLPLQRLGAMLWEGVQPAL